jgi:hypothetical protein
VEYAGVEVTAAITAGGGALLGRTAVRTDTTGAATFEDLSISGTVGEKTLTFSSFGLPGARSSINLTAGVPARLALHYGDNQSTAAGTMLVRAPSVMVVDMDGNPVAGVLVTFGVLSGGGSVTAAHPRSDTAGVATVGSWRLGPAIGTHTLIARAEPIGSVTFTAHGH